ncbi:hypothetical protein BT96DRAFT_596268 [Gymnopus androsaceus JB14]|uniref:Uncharacterized protein n=1 Tax=Gymnopus androsaceus JB14 TaxID=1447944 RepID=A0A6A4HYQ7_9AGAR|nr:hypothetical protein BT96DRAFT_596268 [Gymnopus androsaceus JB14]
MARIKGKLGGSGLGISGISILCLILVLHPNVLILAYFEPPLLSHQGFKGKDGLMCYSLHFLDRHLHSNIKDSQKIYFFNFSLS